MNISIKWHFLHSSLSASAVDLIQLLHERSKIYFQQCTVTAPCENICESLLVWCLSEIKSLAGLLGSGSFDLGFASALVIFSFFLFVFYFFFLICKSQQNFSRTSHFNELLLIGNLFFLRLFVQQWKKLEISHVKWKAFQFLHIG